MLLLPLAALGPDILILIYKKLAKPTPADIILRLQTNPTNSFNPLKTTVKKVEHVEKVDKIEKVEP